MKVHFIGIGGIGISALAQYYLSQGHAVTGFDLARSEITDLLKKKGAVFTEKIPKETSLIVHTSAFPKNSPVLSKAKGEGIEVKSYPEALGDLSKNYFCLAVSGTHGKSTTTSMLALILEKSGLDPTVIVGAKLKEFKNSNFRLGKSKYLVMEADEWNRSFLNYWPNLAVITNIESEHMDTYKDLEDILQTYQAFAGKISSDGVLVLNGDDKNASSIKFPNSVAYSLEQPEAKKLETSLKVPGKHNVSNALAALTAARQIGIPDNISFESLAAFKGAWRRFDIKKTALNKKSFTLISDYGHHPTEIEQTLLAAREKYPKKKIFCIFQPHQHQRTYYLFKDFVRVFSEADIDQVLITDIYDVSGRESKEIKRKVNSKKLVRHIKKENVAYLDKKNLKAYLKKNLKGGEVALIMGAGDIYESAVDLAK